MCALLDWLGDLGGSDASILFIPGDAFAGIPWLALVAGAGIGGSQRANLAGRLTLEPCVSAACHTATDPPVPASNAVIVAPEALGFAEAKFACAALGVAASDAGRMSMLDFLSAITSRGRKHIAVHGAFDPSDPLLGTLQLDPMRTLPFWWLGACAIAAEEITLSTCEGLLCAAGEVRNSLGAGGLAALLRTRGAACVVGPLWQNVQVASVFFYRSWFAARRSMECLPALAAAQRELRNIGFAEFEAVVRDDLPQLGEAGVAYAGLVRRLGWEAPFDHPAIWASYSALGGSREL